MPSSSPLYVLLLTMLLSAVPQVNAQVFRCVDGKGKVTYTDSGCTSNQSAQEVIPPMSAEEKAQMDAQYQQALERKRQEQALQAERDAAERQARAAREAAEAAQKPPVVVHIEPPAQTATPQPPAYGPFYPPHRPPMQRPMPRPPGPDPKAPGYNCNVFKCYDGKGNTWNRP